MPLTKSSSNKARSKNIATEVKAGRKPAQAAAIAYNIQRKAQGNTAKAEAHYDKRSKEV